MQGLDLRMHHGSKTVMAPGMQKDLVRMFQLPEDLFD